MQEGRKLKSWTKLTTKKYQLPIKPQFFFLRNILKLKKKFEKIACAKNKTLESEGESLRSRPPRTPPLVGWYIFERAIWIERSEFFSNWTNDCSVENDPDSHDYS